MRPWRACRTASPARAMSAGMARARPAIVARLARRAISATASKSPFEAIGKPASMMSTPIASSSSATASFSSRLIVAPGHCSPSRNVVSKIRTRSLFGPETLVIECLPCRGPPPPKRIGQPSKPVMMAMRSPEGPGARPDGPQGRVSRRVRRARASDAAQAASKLTGAEPASAKARLSSTSISKPNGPVRQPRRSPVNIPRRPRRQARGVARRPMAFAGNGKARADLAARARRCMAGDGDS